MKTAKEMFEELGFKLLFPSAAYLVWRKEAWVDDLEWHNAKELEFCLLDESLSAGEWAQGYIPDDLLFISTRLSMPEYLAVVQQIKELGW